METYSRVAVVVLGFLLATAAGTPVVRGFFRLVDWQTRREAQRREAAEEGEGGPELIDLRLGRERAARGALARVARTRRNLCLHRRGFPRRDRGGDGGQGIRSLPGAAYPRHRQERAVHHRNPRQSAVGVAVGGGSGGGFLLRSWLSWPGAWS